MLKRFVLLSTIVSLAIPTPTLAAQKRLAVLQFVVAKGLEIDRETFSARVQNAARRAAPDLFVMTQANIETLVRAQGKSLEQCEGQCAVDTGRLIGADLVIGGRISRIGRTYAISMQMYDTASGELTGGEDVSAKTEDELLGALEAAAAKLLSSLGTATAPKQAKAPGRATAASGPPAKVAAKEEVKCPAGQSVGAETEGHCCWTGQVWGGGQCRGVPTSCPDGLQTDGESCAQAACDEGKEQVSGANCCWPGQVWSKTRSQCVGIPRCPSGLEANGEECGAPRGGSTRVEPKSGLEFVNIPGGSFHFGCEPQDTQCYDNEKPGRAASVRAFWLGKTDVTVAAFKHCVDAGACTAANTGGSCNWGTGKMDHPINCVDWTQAQAFCSWSGGRLPSAEEWEYAAKSGESRIYPWGDQQPNGQLAKYGSSDGTAPAGSYTAGASKWGLLDMAGNVWQWTASNYDADNKELRGGSWNSRPVHLRASSRYRYDPSDGSSTFGFRCGL